VINIARRSEECAPNARGLFANERRRRLDLASDRKRAGSGISVSNDRAGGVETEGAPQRRNYRQRPEKQIVADTPLGRMASRTTSREGGAVILASDSARWMTARGSPRTVECAELSRGSAAAPRLNSMRVRFHR